MSIHSAALTDDAHLLPPVRSEIAFIDPGVDDVPVLLAGLRPEVEGVLLTADEPAPRQMARALAGRSGLAAVHVIAHGAPGRVAFSAGDLTAETAKVHDHDLAVLGASVVADGHLRLWSCSAGAGDEGGRFVRAVASATGATVAASVGLVGAADRGGAWTLGVGTATQVPPLTSAGLQAYAGLLAAKSWASPGISGNWSVGANWNGGTVPLAGDTVTLGQPGTGANSYTVTVDTATAVATSIVIGSNTNNQNRKVTLAIGSTGQLNVSGAISFNSGSAASTISMAGGTLTAASIDLSNGASVDGTLSGFGTVTAAINNGGTVKADGGTLQINGTVDATGAATTFQILDGTLKFGDVVVGTSSIHPTIDFQGTTANGVLDLTGMSSANLTAFGANTLIANMGASSTDGVKITGADHVSLAGSALSVFNSSNTLLTTLHFTGTPPTGFYVSNGEIFVCFMAGTRIATPDGARAVETLAIGDLVLTTDGRAVPVRWLGRQTVSTTFADPTRVLPIRIRAGALGDSLPERDLLVSSDHALLIDNILVHAGALINGLSIVREADVPETFTYYHVELADHSLVLAEGVPAETFIDNVNRMAFDNWAEHEALHPEGAPIAEMELPRAKAHRQVPRAIRERLMTRAVALFGTVEQAA